MMCWWFYENKLPCLVCRVDAVCGGKGMWVSQDHYSSGPSPSAREQKTLSHYLLWDSTWAEAGPSVKKQTEPAQV